MPAYRNWRFIVYPDSAPSNWEELLNEQCLCWAHSPLHEPEEDEKKYHWHCVVVFDGKKSFDQVCSALSCTNGPIPKVCDNVRGAVRYFWHLDDKTKKHYPFNEYYVAGGFDINIAFKATAQERYMYLREMRQFCRDNSICDFDVLYDFASENRYEDWFPILCDSGAFVMNIYCNSMWKRRRRKELCVEEVNGDA